RGYGGQLGAGVVPLIAKDLNTTRLGFLDVLTRDTCFGGLLGQDGFTLGDVGEVDLFLTAGITFVGPLGALERDLGIVHLVGDLRGGRTRACVLVRGPSRRQFLGRGLGGTSAENEDGGQDDGV